MDDTRAARREQRQLMQAEQASQIETASQEDACSLMRGFADNWGGWQNCPTVVEAFMKRLQVPSASQTD